MLKLKIFYSLKKIGFFNSLYKKSIFYFLPLIFAIILAPEFVSANILMPGVADGFIYSIPLLIFSPGVILFILPILIGFMFDRRFIAKWNFISLLIVLTTVKLFFVLIETEIYFELIFLLLLYSSFFTIIAFISSTIGKNYKKIYDIQEKFYNVSAKYKILILLILYSLIISPMIYVSSFTPSDYTESLLILSGAIASVLIASLLLLTISKSQTIKPEKKLRFHKKDNHYLSIIITIFIITLILAFIFYPSSGPGIPKFDPEINTVFTCPYGNNYNFIGEIIDVNGTLAFFALNITGYGSHGYTFRDKFVIYGGEVNHHGDINILSKIDGKLTYGFNHSKIYHGGEFIGEKYKLAEDYGSFTSIDNKLTYIAKKENKYFIVQNEEIISEKYESIGVLKNINNKLLYSFKEDEKWYISYDGVYSERGFDSIYNNFETIDGKPVYFVNKNESKYLTYNNKIISDAYLTTFRHNFKIKNDTILFGARKPKNGSYFDFEINPLLDLKVKKIDDEIISFKYNGSEINTKNLTYYEIFDDKLFYILETDNKLSIFYGKESFNFNLSNRSTIRTRIEKDSIEFVNGKISFLVKNVPRSKSYRDVIIFNNKEKVETQLDVEFGIRYNNSLFYFVDNRFFIKCRNNNCDERIHEKDVLRRISPLLVIDDKLKYAIEKGGEVFIIYDNNTIKEYSEEGYLYSIPKFLIGDEYLKENVFFKLENNLFYILKKGEKDSSVASRAYYIYHNHEKISDAIFDKDRLKNKIRDIRIDPSIYIYESYGYNKTYDSVFFEGIFNEEPTFIAREEDNLFVIYGDEIIDKNIECFRINLNSRRAISYSGNIDILCKEDQIAQLKRVYNPQGGGLPIRSFRELNGKLLFSAMINDSLHKIVE